jgi:hypothetical protein
MSPSCKVWWRRGVFLALACLTLLGSGCLPGVAWLPDSSGFIYIDTSGDKFTRVVHFDLATKQSRVLIEKTEETVQPGLSPDGKRIAVARYNAPKDQPRTLQVVILDAKGKELTRSKEFAWKEAPAKGSSQIIELAPALYWSPQGDKIVVYCDSTAGLYDVKAQALQVLADTIIVNIAGTPILPDRSGFLALRHKTQDGKAEKLPVYALIDWQGNATDLKTPEDIFPSDDMGGLVYMVYATMFFAPPMHSSRWDKNVAAITFSGNTLTIDTGKREVSLKKADLVETDDGKKLAVVKLGAKRYLHSRYPLGPGVEVRTVIVEPKKGNGTIRILPAQQQVELLVPGPQEPKVLVPDAAMVIATPSPNGEWLALRCLLLQEGDQEVPDRLLVINRKGEVIEAGVPAK